MEKLISTIVWAAIIQGLLLTLLYLFSRKYGSLANRLLGLFLLTIIYEATVEFLPFEQLFGYPLNFYFSFPEVKIFYSLFFFHYILEKVGRTKRYLRFLKIHYLIAFLFVLITPFNIILFLTTGEKIETRYGFEEVELVFMVQQYYAFLLVILAFILSTKEVSRYKKIVQKEYSDYAMLQINWLWRFIVVILPIVLLWGAELVRILLGGKGETSIVLAIWGFVIIFLYFVSFQAFKHKNLFEGIQDKPEEILEDGAIDEEHYKGGQREMEPEISPEDRQLIERIERYMIAQKPFLDPSLSIHKLARELSIPTRDLSILINHALDKHFFDFINEYRIKDAMKLLADPENQKMTVLEILYEVGFNSKSSFNTVFKKYTGKTPTEYRKTHSLSTS